METLPVEFREKYLDAALGLNLFPSSFEEALIGGRAGTLVETEIGAASAKLKSSKS